MSDSSKAIDISGFSERINSLSPERRKLLDILLGTAARESSNSESAYAAPETPVQQIVAGIWAEVLRLPRVGIDDDFFKLGGDSIYSIQIIAKAHRAGLSLTNKQLFEHRTIRALSKAVLDGQDRELEGKAPPSTVPLTPLQLSVLDRPSFKSERWCHSILLQAAEDCTPVLLRKAVRQLTLRHQALTLRVGRSADGWYQFQRTLDDALLFPVIDLSDVVDSKRESVVSQIESHLQAAVEIDQGALLRTAFIKPGAGAPAQVLILVHCLAADSYSIGILLEDLADECITPSRTGQSPRSGKSASFADWATQFANQPPGASLQPVGRLSDATNIVESLPADFQNGESTGAPSTRVISKSLPVEETEHLFHECPEAYRCSLPAILLAPLAYTIRNWAHRTSLSCELELEPRDAGGTSLDLLRTVGWIKSVLPLQLGLNDNASLADALKTIKDQLRRVTDGHGQPDKPGGQTEHSDVPARAWTPGQSQLKLSYRATPVPKPPDCSAFRVLRISYIDEISMAARADLIAVSVFRAGNGQLIIEWRYNSNVYRSTTIERIAADYSASLRSLIQTRFTLAKDTLTPSDFPEAGLSNSDLRQIISKIE